MAIAKFANGSMFVPIRSGHNCPVCGSKKGRCAEFYNSDGELVFYRCKYKTSDKFSNGWYIHLSKDINGYDTSSKVVYLNSVEETPITHDILVLRDKVYRMFRELTKKYLGSYLTADDMKDLTNRGLNEMQILKMGFFSVPSMDKEVWADCNFKVKMQTAISKSLEEEFGAENLLKVPGFVKRKNKNSSEFVSFKTFRINPEDDSFMKIKGYFIPYFNIEGLLVGLQYRLTEKVYDEKGKPMRYFWYSSEQARSGAPIDYYVPTKVVRDDILLVTEGGTKGKIASEKLGFKGVFEAGVHNYKNLVKNIQVLETMNDFKYKIILALDIDKYTVVDDEGRYPVLEAENKTISLLKSAGHQIAIAEWNGKKAKGIDDALKLDLKISYNLI